MGQIIMESKHPRHREPFLLNEGYRKGYLKERVHIFIRRWNARHQCSAELNSKSTPEFQIWSLGLSLGTTRNDNCIL